MDNAVHDKRVIELLTDIRTVLLVIALALGFIAGELYHLVHA